VHSVASGVGVVGVAGAPESLVVDEKPPPAASAAGGEATAIASASATANRTLVPNLRNRKRVSFSGLRG
jgi:hypothetical protein